jgi:proteasome lid subunit RPN8/RPN11
MVAVLVHVTQRVVRSALAHAEACYPHEACGLLGGTRAGTSLCFTRYLSLRNLAGSAHGFSVAAADFARREAELRAAACDQLAFFHSHPDVEDHPSPQDIAAAWPRHLQWICGVHAGVAGPLTCWRPADGQVTPVTWQTEPNA